MSGYSISIACSLQLTKELFKEGMKEIIVTISIKYKYILDLELMDVPFISKVSGGKI
jgi:L-ribulose-5-phosphate 3-epimerase UlaE